FKQDKHHIEVVVALGTAVEYDVWHRSFVCHLDAVPPGELTHDRRQGFTVEIKAIRHPGGVLVGVDLLYTECSLLQDALLAGRKPVHRCWCCRVSSLSSYDYASRKEGCGGKGLIGVGADIEFRTGYFDSLVAAIHDEGLVDVFGYREVCLAREGNSSFGFRKTAGVGEGRSGIEPNVGAVG